MSNKTLEALENAVNLPSRRLIPMKSQNYLVPLKSLKSLKNLNTLGAQRNISGLLQGSTIYTDAARKCNYPTIEVKSYPILHVSRPHS